MHLLCSEINEINKEEKYYAENLYKIMETSSYVSIKCNKNIKIISS